MKTIADTEKVLKEFKVGKHLILEMDDAFKFECALCGGCCFNNAVALNCYDVVRLRHGVGASTTEILQKGVIDFHIGPSSGMPICTIQFQEALSKTILTKCPFLLPIAHEATLTLESTDIEAGKWACSVYKDRPVPCRLFPCGRVKSVNKETGKVKQTFFLQEIDEFCPGLKGKKEQTLKQYLDATEFKHYDEGSAKFANLITKMSKTGFFAPTKDNKSVPAVLKKGSETLFILGNIMYNFDSFNYFSNDTRVLKTITDPNATQEDFIYVVDKIETLVFSLIRLHKEYKGDDEAIMQIINKNMGMGGEK